MIFSSASMLQRSAYGTGRASSFVNAKGSKAFCFSSPKGMPLALGNVAGRTIAQKIGKRHELAPKKYRGLGAFPSITLFIDFLLPRCLGKAGEATAQAVKRKTVVSNLDSAFNPPLLAPCYQA